MRASSEAWRSSALVYDNPGCCIGLLVLLFLMYSVVEYLYLRRLFFVSLASSSHFQCGQPVIEYSTLSPVYQRSIEGRASAAASLPDMLEIALFAGLGRSTEDSTFPNTDQLSAAVDVNTAMGRAGHIVKKCCSCSVISHARASVIQTGHLCLAEAQDSPRPHCSLKVTR